MCKQKEKRIITASRKLPLYHMGNFAVCSRAAFLPVFVGFCLRFFVGVVVLSSYLCNSKSLSLHCSLIFPSHSYLPDDFIGASDPSMVQLVRG